MLAVCAAAAMVMAGCGKSAAVSTENQTAAVNQTNTAAAASMAANTADTANAAGTGSAAENTADTAAADNSAAAAQTTTGTAAQIGKALLDGIKYDDDLVTIDYDTADGKIGFSDEDIQITDSCFYMGSGATAEEIAVVVCKDEANAASAKTVLQAHVEDQLDTYKDYAPKEVPKLKSAVLEQKGNTVVLSISGDSSKAESIIAQYLK